MDVSAQHDLRSRVGSQLPLEVVAVHQVTGVRKTRPGHPERLGQDGKVRGDDDDVGRATQADDLTDVLRRRRAPADRDTRDGDPRELERLRVQQPNPVLAGGFGKHLAEAEIVVSVHRRQRGDLRRRETGKHVSEIARVWELHDVSQQQDQIDPSFGEPLERRVGAPVEVLGLEDIDPARPGRLELAVEIAEDADAHCQGVRVATR